MADSSIPSGAFGSSQFVAFNPSSNRPVRPPNVGTVTPTAAVTANTPLDQLSFGDLAKARTLPLVDKIFEGVKGTDPNAAMPHEEPLKDLRKEIQKLRNHLDVFVFSYADGVREKDWRAFRELLDEGYESIGEFKDLFESQGLELKRLNPQTGQIEGDIDEKDVKYNQTTLARRRERMVKWFNEYTAPQTAAKYRELIATPSQTIADIQNQNITRFFWGSVGFRPDPAVPGAKTIGRLASELAANAADQVVKTAATLVTIEDDNEDTFHDTRKYMRSVSNLVKNFAEILPADAQTPLRLIDRAVSRYGNIEELIVARHLAKEDGDTQRSQEMTERIATAWKELQTWQKQEDLVGNLKKVAEAAGLG